MNAFIFMPMWCGVTYFFSRTNRISVVELDGEKKVIRQRMWYALFAFLPIFLLASIGEPCADTISYLNSYSNASISFLDINFNESGWGFSLFTTIVKIIFGDNVVPYRVIIALFHSIPIVLMFRKYSHNYFASLFLFISSACYLSWMMNGLRQFVAVTLILGSTPLLLKKKYIQLSLVILIATTIHQSAIIMLPIVFIAQGRVFNRSTMFFIIVSVVVMWLFGQNGGLFEIALSGTEYESGYNLIKDIDDGVSPIRVLINAIPVVLAFLDRNRLERENDKFCNICVNMSMITLGVSLVAMVTSGIFVGRLIIYTQLFNYIIMPKLINDTFNRRSRVFVYLMMVIFYLIYYKYELGNYFYYDIDVLGGLK